MNNNGSVSAVSHYCFGRKEAETMNVNVGDVLVMKKNHPCGCNRFLVLRTGMDFKIRCENCGHEVMVARSKAEKNIRQIIPAEEAK